MHITATHQNHSSRRRSLLRGRRWSCSLKKEHNRCTISCLNTVDQLTPPTRTHSGIHFSLDYRQLVSLTALPSTALTHWTTINWSHSLHYHQLLSLTALPSTALTHCTTINWSHSLYFNCSLACDTTGAYSFK